MLNGTGTVRRILARLRPDPTRAAAYLPAYGMVVLTLVLLLKPSGLFGRKA